MPTAISPVDVSPASTSTAFQSVDLSAHIPTSASGVIVWALNADTAEPSWGMRMPGGTDIRGVLENDDGQGPGKTQAHVGVNASQQIEVLMTNLNVQYWLVGYWEDTEASFFQSVPQITTDQPGTWTDRDISAHTGTDMAKVAFLSGEITGTSKWTVRRNGEPTAPSGNVFSGDLRHALTGLDANEIFEEIGDSAGSVEVSLYGYVFDGSTIIDEVDITPGTLNSYVTIDVSAHVSAEANGAYIRSYNSEVEHRANSRPAGSTTTAYEGEVSNWQTYWVPLNSNGEFEHETDFSSANLTIIGYTEPVASTTNYDVSGQVTAAGGAGIGSATVEIRASDETLIDSTVADGSGNFSMTGTVDNSTLPDTWTIHADPPGYFSGQRDVAVSSSSATFTGQDFSLNVLVAWPLEVENKGGTILHAMEEGGGVTESTDDIGTNDADVTAGVATGQGVPTGGNGLQGSFDFDGTQGSTVTTRRDILDQNVTAISIEVWVDADLLENRGIFGETVTGVGGGDSGLHLRFDESGFVGRGTDVMKMSIDTTTSSQARETANGDAKTGLTQYIMRWQQGGDLELVIDGTETTYSGIGGDSPVNGELTQAIVGQLVLGRSNYNGGPIGIEFDGIMAGAAIYPNIYLTDQQAQDLFQAGQGQGGQVFDDSVASSLGVGELSGADVSANASVSSSLPLTDSAALAAILNTALASTGPLTDAVQAMAVANPSIASALAAADQTSSLVSKDVSVASSVTPTDAAQAILSVTPSIQSGVGLTDALQAVMDVLDAVVTSTLAAADVADVAQTFQGLVAGQITPTDAIQAVAQIAGRITSDTTLSDDTENIVDGVENVDVDSQVGVSDQAEAQVVFETDAASAQTLTDATVATKVIQGTITSAVSLTDEEEASVVARVSISEALTATDVAEALLSAGVDLSSALAVADAVSGEVVAFSTKLPDGRTLVVDPESRTLIIKMERRTLHIPDEPRTLTIKL